MSNNLLAVAYVAASALFILSLASLSTGNRSQGNLYGIAGMLIAFTATTLSQA